MYRNYQRIVTIGGFDQMSQNLDVYI